MGILGMFFSEIHGEPLFFNLCGLSLAPPVYHSLTVQEDRRDIFFFLGLSGVGVAGNIGALLWSRACLRFNPALLYQPALGMSGVWTWVQFLAFVSWNTPGYPWYFPGISMVIQGECVLIIELFLCLNFNRCLE